MAYKRSHRVGDFQRIWLLLVIYLPNITCALYLIMNAEINPFKIVSDLTLIKESLPLHPTV
jgi:hypothetical protein